MAEKDLQWGIVLLIGAAIFLMSGLDMLDFEIVDQQFSTLMAFVFVAAGIYLITKK